MSNARRTEDTPTILVSEPLFADVLKAAVREYLALLEMRYESQTLSGDSKTRVATARQILYARATSKELDKAS